MLNPLHPAWLKMVILSGAIATVAGQEITFSPDDSVFPNPERGFTLYQGNLARLTDEVTDIRNRGMTLVWTKIDLSPYRQLPDLPGSFLADLQQGLAGIRDAGAKAIVRAAYGHRGPGGDYQSYEDPPREIIEAHIEQLGPLFHQHADGIALFEAGFLGPWGEWHTTSLSRDPTARRELFFHLLNHTPASRMVLVRYPALKQSLFQSEDPLSPEEAFQGTARARTGHHNDCFLSSPTDMGTYQREGKSMAQEKAYLRADTVHTPFGGETCALHPRSLPTAALEEMEALHLTYLNASYHPEVMERWREMDFLETVERRMGARLQLRTLRLPKTATPGEEISLAFEVSNTGFAALFNERPLLLRLRDAAGQEIRRYPLSEIDPRRWLPGACHRFAVTVELPETLPPGIYQWTLQLPDPSPRLADDPRFAYRLANHEIWVSATGEHRLVTDWRVDVENR